MNRPLGRIRLLIEEPTIITKRRPPRIDAGGRPAREIDTREPAPTIPHAIPMSTFWVLKWERWYFNVFSVPKII